MNDVTFWPESSPVGGTCCRASPIATCAPRDVMLSKKVWERTQNN